MIGLKRFVRPDVVVSAIGHVGVLMLSLVVFGAGADRRVPPEVMTVEIVPPDEAPPFEPQHTETQHVDGTLASEPIILDASFLPGTSELIRAAKKALETCQPYAELPKDKYNEWRTLDMVVTRQSLSGR